MAASVFQYLGETEEVVNNAKKEPAIHSPVHLKYLIWVVALLMGLVAPLMGVVALLTGVVVLLMGVVALLMGVSLSAVMC